MKYEVYDVNCGETLHSFRNWAKAAECARDMNKGHLDKMYAVRDQEVCAHESTWTTDGNGAYCRFCGETLA